jgi:hypothetical protein
MTFFLICSSPWHCPESRLKETGPCRVWASSLIYLRTASSPPTSINPS